MASLRWHCSFILRCIHYNFLIWIEKYEKILGWCCCWTWCRCSTTMTCFLIIKNIIVWFLFIYIWTTQRIISRLRRLANILLNYCSTFGQGNDNFDDEEWVLNERSTLTDDGYGRAVAAHDEGARRHAVLLAIRTRSLAIIYFGFCFSKENNNFFIVLFL